MAFFQRVTDFEGRKKSAVAAEKILGAVQQGIFKRGERLPSERTIAEELGVSRPPIREALSALQIMGVVDIIVGDGTYVKINTHSRLPDSKTIKMLEENESPFEVLRARQAIETVIIQIAATEANEDDLINLRSKLSEIKQAIDNHDFEAYFEANRNFHLFIAHATHNSIFVRIMEFLFEAENQPLWREVCQKHFSNLEHINFYFPQHQRMLEAIEAGDRDRARNLAYDHFSRTVDEVNRYL
ncbi:MAG: FadR/GntR family transcriptional regulator [Desulfobacteraceae bacterium]|jgi:GntR family transcriptional repressor for pyruvate dehydrogenase complex